MDPLQKGERVTFENGFLRKHCPEFYPEEGVEGIVAERERDGRASVDWPDGAIRFPRAQKGWFTAARNLRRVERRVDR